MRVSDSPNTPRSNYNSMLAYSLFVICGAPGRIRTHDPLVRSQVLYPTELRARGP